MLLSSRKTILTLRMMMLEDGSKSGDEESLDSFLTERQIEVLQMRLAGRSQQEVAEILGTTRSNISILCG